MEQNRCVPVKGAHLLAEFYTTPVGIFAVKKVKIEALGAC
jgi:hypothetical protein